MPSERSWAQKGAQRLHGSTCTWYQSSLFIETVKTVKTARRGPEGSRDCWLMVTGFSFRAWQVLEMDRAGSYKALGTCLMPQRCKLPALSSILQKRNWLNGNFLKSSKFYAILLYSYVFVYLYLHLCVCVCVSVCCVCTC